MQSQWLTAIFGLTYDRHAGEGIQQLVENLTERPRVVDHENADWSREAGFF